VINYDVPIEKDSYVHRIGRTGRAGNLGRAISLVTGEDIMTLYEIEEHIGVLIEEMELPSEALLNERRASADNWIKANSVKREQSPRATSKSNVNRNQKKNSHTRYPKHHEERRERPSQVNRERNTSPGVNKTHVAQQAKPVPAISKPATPQSREANVVKAKPGNEIMQNQDSNSRPEKKPFHQRLLKRILGR